MKFGPGGASLKLAHGHVRYNLRTGLLRRCLRPVVLFASFIMAFSLISSWRQHMYSDYTSALLNARPLLPQPQPQVFRYTPRHSNGFGAQVLHLLDAVAVAQLMNPPAVLCVTQTRYWNYGCGPYKGWGCYFKSALCDDDDRTDNNNNKFGIRLNNGKNDDDNRNCRELSKLHAKDVWTTPCILISSHVSHRRTAIVTRRLAAQHPLSSLAFVRGVAKTLWQLNDRTTRAIILRLAGVGLAINLRPGDSEGPDDDGQTESDVGVSAKSRWIGPEDNIGKKATAVEATDNTRTRTGTGATLDGEGGVEGDGDGDGDGNSNDNVNDEVGENDNNDNNITDNNTKNNEDDEYTPHDYMDGKYVAIHVRRGDKTREVRSVNLRAFADAVTLLARRGEPVFIATDDGSVVPYLRDLLHPNHHVITLNSVIGRTGHRQGEHNRGWMKTRYGTVVDLLAEIEAMRRARVFIATFSSNLARLVHVLRKADEHDSISLDDRWAPGVAWLTFGQAYCGWPGANETFCQLWESN